MPRADAIDDSWPADAAAIARIETPCLAVVAGKLAVRELGRWAAAAGISESELRLLWQLFLTNRPAADQRRQLLDQAELAVRLSLSPAQVSSLVERLRGRALIAPADPDRDRRRQLWQLTEMGWARLAQAIAAVGAPQHTAVGKGAA